MADITNPNKDELSLPVPRPGGKKANEIRITGVGANTQKQLENIASHIGVPLASFMKPHLKKIIEQYPEHQRNTYCDNKPELTDGYIRSVLKHNNSAKGKPITQEMIEAKRQELIAKRAKGEEE